MDAARSTPGNDPKAWTRSVKVWSPKKEGRQDPYGSLISPICITVMRVFKWTPSVYTHHGTVNTTVVMDTGLGGTVVVETVEGGLEPQAVPTGVVGVHAAATATTS